MAAMSIERNNLLSVFNGLLQPERFKDYGPNGLQVEGKGEIRREGHARAGQRVAIMAFGSMVHPALTAAEQLDATVANMRFVKPLDVELVKQLAANHDFLVTVEEGATMGGAGSAVLEALAEADIALPTLVLGLPDKFIDHGDPAHLLSLCGLDAAGIERSVRERFGLTAQPVKVASVA